MEYPNIELSQKAKEIQDAFAEIPPDYDKIKKMFAEYQPTEAEMVMIANDIIDNVISINEDKKIEINGQTIMFSDFAYKSMELLLSYGLNPNIVVNDDILIWNVQYINVEDLGRKLMRLLLDNKADPNLQKDGWNLLTQYYSDADLDTYDMEDFEYSKVTVQCFFLLGAYNAKFDDGDTFDVFMVNNHKAGELREFEKYDIRVDWLPKTNPNVTEFNIIGFLKDTNEEIVKIECGWGKHK